MKDTRLKGRFSYLIIISIIVISFFYLAQPITEEPFRTVERGYDSCTSIQIGKLATTDGSVITAHTCDGYYRQWLKIEPNKTYPVGAMKNIVWGTMHTETSWDLRGLDIKGQIPQVAETYAYMDVAYPCMNEHQLAIGETTIGGRDDLYNDEGFFLIEELERVALERCTNARDAIRLIGELVKEFGYGDGGECITIADPQEVWHFEIFGAGPLEIGAVWAAVRIPDDHVGVSANIPRISTLDLDNPDRYMASENVFSLAEEMGWWSRESGEEFKFWKAYSGEKPYSIREFYVLSTIAPSLNLTRDMDELPFSVKAEKKLSIRDVMKYYREYYEGTEYDMTKNFVHEEMEGYGSDRKGTGEMMKNPYVSPYMPSELRDLFNILKPGTIERLRPISVEYCSYSQINQCREGYPPGLGGIAWFSFDIPGMSPRIPIFAGVTELPKSFEIGAQHRYRDDSAAWAFRRANRLAMIKWGEARELIESSAMEFENRAFNELDMVEKRALELYNKGDIEGYKQFLTKYTNDFARATIDRWKEVGDELWMMYARGF
ncbi:MAG: peptidase [bacterium]|nr:peptidase [bacterium]